MIYPLVFAIQNGELRGGQTATVDSTPLPFAIRPLHFRIAPGAEHHFLLEWVGLSGQEAFPIPVPIPDWAFGQERVSPGFRPGCVLPPGSVISLRVKNIWAGALDFCGVLFFLRDDVALDPLTFTPVAPD